MNTPEGRQKGVVTILKRDPQFYAKIGAKGGKNSSNRPMTDPSYASKLAKRRWAKYRWERDIITQKEYEDIMETLNVSNTTL